MEMIIIAAMVTMMLMTVVVLLMLTIVSFVLWSLHGYSLFFLSFF